MIVWLASYPRAGNTFLRIILNSLFHVKTASVYSGPLEGIMPEYNQLVGYVRPEGSLQSLQASEATYFIKTHELPSTSDNSTAIYIVRDGRDTLVSYAHFALTFEPEHYSNRTFQETLRMLIESKQHFGGWSKHVESWKKRDGSTVIIRYEDLINDPVGLVIKACKRVKLALPPLSGTLPDFESLKATIPSFFRKGKSGNWKLEMSAELEELFWSIHGTTMLQMGYSR